METMAWIWLAVIVVSIIAEAATSALVAIWFLPGAAISLLLSFFDVQLWIQAVVFFGLSLLLLLRIIIKSPLKTQPYTPTNAETLIGKQAVVTENISNIEGKGAVKINSLVWSARAQNDGTEYSVGDVVTVTAIDGVKLICK